jgi:hypothetical protein
MVNNQPGSALASQINPHPLDKDTDTETGLREKLEMNCSPCKTREESAHANLATLQDGKSFPDYGHFTFIEIPERRFCRPPGDQTLNGPTRVTPLLNGNLRYT